MPDEGLVSVPLFNGFLFIPFGVLVLLAENTLSNCK